MLLGNMGEYQWNFTDVYAKDKRLLLQFILKLYEALIRKYPVTFWIWHVNYKLCISTRVKLFSSLPVSYNIIISFRLYYFYLLTTVNSHNCLDVKRKWSSLITKWMLPIDTKQDTSTISIEKSVSKHKILLRSW